MILMADSTVVANLPDAYDAYLGYGNGIYNTANDLAAKFPNKPRVILSVEGDAKAANCDGVDIEKGDYSATSGVAAIVSILDTTPVVYASVAGNPGESMSDVLSALQSNNIPRSKVRLLAAHWNYQRHICGPNTCRAISIDMDGTQYSNQGMGLNGSVIDVSTLNDSFFSSSQPMENEKDMLIIDGFENGAIYLLAGGRLHHITSTSDLAAYRTASIPEITVSLAEANALLADYPGGTPSIPPAVTIPSLVVPSFTISPQ